jgi:hypothetical protein
MAEEMASFLLREVLHEKDKTQPNNMKIRLLIRFFTCFILTVHNFYGFYCMVA